MHVRAKILQLQAFVDKKLQMQLKQFPTGGVNHDKNNKYLS